MRRGLRSVTGTEQIGPYTLLRVESGDLEQRRSRPVLHARGARSGAAEADEPLPGRCRRARLPDRSDRTGDACALRPRARRRVARARPARERLRPRRRAAAARRRRHRRRTAAVPLCGAARTRHRRSSASAATGTPRRRRSFRTQRSASSRPTSPSCSPTIRSTCSPAAPSRCSPRSAGASPTRSSPGRRRWRAATAPATAAPSRSTAS